MGPPGAGKGTLGRFLDHSMTQKYVSSGEIFRSLDVDSSAGELYQSYASKHQLVPDAIALEICRHYISGLIASNAFYPTRQYLLLEGIPRTRGQAEAMLEWFDINHVIVLECFNQENLRKRLHRRARIEGKFNLITEKDFEQLYSDYEKESEAIFSLFPKHLISVIEAEQKPLEVLRDVLDRLSHILSLPPRTK